MNHKPDFKFQSWLGILIILLYNFFIIELILNKIIFGFVILKSFCKYGEFKFFFKLESKFVCQIAHKYLLNIRGGHKLNVLISPLYSTDIKTETGEMHICICKATM